MHILASFMIMKTWENSNRLFQNAYQSPNEEVLRNYEKLCLGKGGEELLILVSMHRQFSVLETCIYMYLHKRLEGNS